MASFNKVLLLGNLTRDPEVRTAPTGLTICKLGLAVNRSYTTKEGEKRDETTFVDVDAFGRQAEVLGQYMRKGRPIFIEGRLKYDQWETPEGDKRSKLGVVLESFQFLGDSRDSESAGSATGEEPTSPPKRNLNKGAPVDPGSGPDEPHDEDDVPF
jgi:single-strand DNA-binding protein